WRYGLADECFSSRHQFVRDRCGLAPVGNRNRHALQRFESELEWPFVREPVYRRERLSPSTGLRHAFVSHKRRKRHYHSGAERRSNLEPTRSDDSYAAEHDGFSEHRDRESIKTSRQTD